MFVSHVPFVLCLYCFCETVGASNVPPSKASLHAFGNLKVGAMIDGIVDGVEVTTHDTHRDTPKHVNMGPSTTQYINISPLLCSMCMCVCVLCVVCVRV